MWSGIASIVPLAMAYMAPMLIIALGGIFSERSGIANIALEGLMGVGAFAAAYTIYILYPSMGNSSVWVGLIAAALCGGLLSLLHAFASINMNADQVISGTAINILSSAITVFLARSLTGSGTIQIVRGFIKKDVPVLSKIPVLGLLFKNAYPTTYVVLFILFISWYVLYYTPFGLRLRSCGENPHAAASLGIDVQGIRYAGVILSGILSGLGGGIVIVTYSGEFSSIIYSGLGYLALAAVIFGQWNPWGVLGATAFFGLAKTAADMSKLFAGLNNMPNIIFNTFPYVATIIALMLFSKNAAGPRASGEPYDPGKR